MSDELKSLYQAALNEIRGGGAFQRFLERIASLVQVAPPSAATAVDFNPSYALQAAFAVVPGTTSTITLPQPMHVLGIVSVVWNGPNGSTMEFYLSIDGDVGDVSTTSGRANVPLVVSANRRSNGGVLLAAGTHTVALWARFGAGSGNITHSDLSVIGCL